MKEVKRPTTVKKIVLMMINFMMLSAIACGSDGDTAGITDSVNSTDSDALVNMAPSYQCQDIILESDLSKIFEKEVTYASATPLNIVNSSSCDFESPDTEDTPDSVSGSINLYCNPAPNQTTVEKYFQVTEVLILKGYSELSGQRMVFENVTALPQISSSAYYFTSRLDTGLRINTLTHKVMFIHDRTNCNIEISAYDSSGTDLSNAIIAAAEKINANLQP